MTTESERVKDGIKVWSEKVAAVWSMSGQGG
jgi:hypothetical protein